jgi:hypothetical protein
MTVRTGHSTVTFVRPFVLSALEGEQPAGTYAIGTDEELLPGLSFPVYRRVARWIRVPSRPGSAGFAPGFAQIVTIDPEELTTTLARDAAIDRPEAPATPATTGASDAAPQTQRAGTARGGVRAWLRNLVANTGH